MSGFMLLALLSVAALTIPFVRAAQREDQMALRRLQS